MCQDLAFVAATVSPLIAYVVIERQTHARRKWRLSTRQERCQLVWSGMKLTFFALTGCSTSEPSIAWQFSSRTLNRLCDCRRLDT